MRIAQGLASLLAALSLAACASAAVNVAADDAQFVWGCWVAKDEPGGPPVAFLRLLPDGTGYAGHLTNVRGGKWDVRARYTFARDGSQVILAPTGGEATVFLRTQGVMAPRPPVGAARLTYSDGRQQLEVEGGDATLLIVRRDGQAHIWAFERDGCD